MTEIEDKKECSLCGEPKPFSAFYVSSGYKDGHTKRCKECTKKKAREREVALLSTPEGVEKERARHRDKYHRKGYKDLHKPTYEQKKKAMGNYISKFPEKHAAKTGSSRLNPKIKGNQLHHWSYNDEHFKCVIEISVKNHNTAHRFMVYDQERKMYRKLDGVLLDTRKAHEAHIEEVINNDIINNL